MGDDLCPIVEERGFAFFIFSLNAVQNLNGWRLLFGVVRRVVRI